MVSEFKPYMVYLVRAQHQKTPKYDAWLCGGTLVTKEHVITSAACVWDVTHVYVIAGYNKYVTDENIEIDDCTSKMKKRVVFKSFTLPYNFSYLDIEKWAYVDISVIRVESPYNLNDASYQLVCTYIPSIIPVNFDEKYQNVDTDVMVLGWGHKKHWRQSTNKKNGNSEFLHYASMKIFDKELCKQKYHKYPRLVEAIDKYMICTMFPGNLNDLGQPINNLKDIVEGCGKNGNNGQKLLFRPKAKPEECEVSSEEVTAKPVHSEPVTVEPDTEEPYIEELFDETRKRISPDQTLKIDHEINISDDNGTYYNLNRTGYSLHRRSEGICQNDHGGPLITWIGARQVMVGVASVFSINDDNECIGPYLFTSTQCNGYFLQCMITANFTEKKRQRKNMTVGSRPSLCDSPASLRGFEILTTEISWKHHPAGPADNERHEENTGYGSKDSFIKQFGFVDTATEEIENPLNKNKKISHVEPKDRFSELVGFPLRDRFIDKLNFPAKKIEPVHVNPPPKHVEPISIPDKINEPAKPSSRFTQQLSFPAKNIHPFVTTYEKNVRNVPKLVKPIQIKKAPPSPVMEGPRMRPLRPLRNL